MFNYDDAKKRLETTKIENGEIIELEFVPDGKTLPVFGIELGPLPEYCRICVRLKPSKNSNILVEVWLPVKEWNGNFLGTGNGGSAGSITPLSLVNGVSRGFAVANTDMGTTPYPDALIGDPERWADFGYRSTHLMTVVAKQLIEAFYGNKPKYSYFTGSSTGGQQALMEAQRYPEDYDGILVSAPANNRTHLHIAFIWNWLAQTKSPDAAISAEQATAITKRIIEVYGPEAGAIPGDMFMLHPERINIDVEIFKDFLNSEQMEALQKNYAGTVNPVTGERVFSPLTVPGSESSGLGLSEHGKDKFAEDFFYLFRWIFGKDYDFTKFDFDKDIEIINEKLAPILNANNPDLSGFKKAGGKMIMLHGLADPIIPYTDSLHYYERVIKEQGSLENTMDFFRYFLVPGFAHSIGGPGVHEVAGNGFPAAPKDREHDALSALIAWVEEGITPEILLPVAFKDGSVANGFLQKEYEYERPVYVYPYEAVYVEGDPNNLKNYKKERYHHTKLENPADKYLV